MILVPPPLWQAAKKASSVALCGGVRGKMTTLMSGFGVVPSSILFKRSSGKLLNATLTTLTPVL